MSLADYDIGAAFQAIEDELIASMTDELLTKQPDLEK